LRVWNCKSKERGEAIRMRDDWNEESSEFEKRGSKSMGEEIRIFGKRGLQSLKK